MTPVIELEGLGVRLGKRDILKGLTCSLSGRTIGLLGPNGAGKSTLINTLLGFYPPCQGTARIFGHDVRTDLKHIRALAGYMPENDAFIANMTAVSFIRLMAELSGLPSDAALERAHQLAKLAQAIVHGPKLIVLDEPTNGLDPPARQRMIRMIKEMRDTHHLHIVLCSHLLRDVEETCEEVLILKDGRIVHYSNLEEERSANRRFVEMEPVGDGAALAHALEEIGCECAFSSSHRLKAVLSDGIEIRDIYRLAAEREIQLRRLNYRRDTLEDIFLKAMETNGNGGL
jgi:ABC-2 type transport system ATP-binding protein